MLTEINLRDASGKFEYSIECDFEKGVVIGWHVSLTEPMPLQSVLNVPMLTRPASVTAPCQQANQQPAVSRSAKTVVPSNKIRIGKDGTPIVEG